MLLRNKNAVIYGAAGSMGGAVARALSRAGARVFLTGRNLASVREVADEIRGQGGSAEANQVDALDENAVESQIQRVVQAAATVDISFCAIDLQVVQNIPLVDLSANDFVRPVAIAMRAHFLTATAAARVMMKQGSGVILSLTATPGGIGYPFTAGFAPACAAIESFSRNLASEIGPYGIRVVNIRSAGSPDSRVFQEAIRRDPEAMTPILLSMESDTMLKRLPSITDVASVAEFLSSDMAGTITGVTVDVTCGTTAGLNSKVAARGVR